MLRMIPRYCRSDSRDVCDEVADVMEVMFDSLYE